MWLPRHPRLPCHIISYTYIGNAIAMSPTKYCTQDKTNEFGNAITIPLNKLHINWECDGRVTDRVLYKGQQNQLIWEHDYRTTEQVTHKLGMRLLCHWWSVVQRTKTSNLGMRLPCNRTSYIYKGQNKRIWECDCCTTKQVTQKLGTRLLRHWLSVDYNREQTHSGTRLPHHWTSSTQIRNAIAMSPIECRLD